MDRHEEFREFFAARRVALSRTALFLTGDHGVAEDLLQEAMLKALRHWRRLATGGNPEAYVRQVLLNESRTRWRRQRLRPETVTMVAAERPDGTRLEAEAVERSVLATALRQLAHRQRAVLYLRFYEDLSVAETARLLECSVGTVKSQTHDALIKLRRIAPELQLGVPEAGEASGVTNSARVTQPGESGEHGDEWR